MREHVDRFLAHLRDERNLSPETVRAYSGDLRQLCESLAAAKGRIPRPSEVDRLDVRRFLAELADRGVAKRSAARKLAAIRTMFRWLMRRGMISSNPVSGVRTPRLEKRLPHHLTPEQTERLITAPPENTVQGLRDRAIMELLYSAGLRVQELVGLDTDHVDLEAGVALVRGKGRKERLAPVGRPAVRAIERYLSERTRALQGKDHDAAALFLNRFGNRLTARSVRRILSKWADEADLPKGTTPHTLRHSFATHMLSNGADLRSVQELLGHAHLSSTQIYTHVTNDQLKRAHAGAHPRGGPLCHGGRTDNPDDVPAEYAAGAD